MTTTATTLTRFASVYDALRTANPDTYREDFHRVLDELHTNGADAANTLKREIIGK